MSPEHVTGTESEKCMFDFFTYCTANLFFSVESVVNFLRCQAGQASCPLDLLAAEFLGSRLVSRFSSSCDQLLTKEHLVHYFAYSPGSNSCIPW